MSDWRSILHYDPLPLLLSPGDSAIAVFTAQDLLGQTDQDIITLWDLPDAKQIASKPPLNGKLRPVRDVPEPGLFGRNVRV